MKKPFDILIIGGGINGSGIARDAAGRGLRVCLVEMNDLASGTSSASTKMIHGGLRYLEYYEFGLVRQALKEREKLLAIAPHLISPLRIVLPILPKMRPAWLIRIGLWIYDHLGGKISLPATSNISLSTAPEGKPLAPGPTRAFAYSDGWVDDARLVTLNAVDAAKHGADIRTRCKLTKLTPKEGLWEASLVSEGKTSKILTRSVINAAGPWADQVDALGGLDHAAHMVKVQGSHIIVPKLYDGDHAYLLQNPDRRVVFSIPYQGKFTLFGTTDTVLEDDPETAHLNEEESEYLLQSIHRFFKDKPKKKDIVWSYSGVRALFGDPEKEAASLSRDYELVMDPPGDTPPFLSILGGKITTFRSLSEKAVNMVAARLNGESGDPWTADTPLPGGDLEATGVSGLAKFIRGKWPLLFTEETALRLAKAYGTWIELVLDGVTESADLGQNFGHGFSEKEARYLVEHEWAKTTEDLLWRRSKIGLHLNKAQIKKVDAWLLTELAAKPAE
ncbi:MAG: glycerol-3-phosphate dehydrogenase [Robiginitomaculum sp.]|nr:MAG: glycerol-3-phosphate dehydrogenase [Robiginitomaculum sp.]